MAKFTSTMQTISMLFLISNPSMISKCLLENAWTPWSPFMIWILPSLFQSHPLPFKVLFLMKYSSQKTCMCILSPSLSEFSFYKISHPEYLVFSTHPQKSKILTLTHVRFCPPPYHYFFPKQTTHNDFNTTSFQCKPYTLQSNHYRKSGRNEKKLAEIVCENA